jgi:threonine/homoserine/homoserine lactone efflux protein
MNDLVYWLVVLLAFIAGGTLGAGLMAILAASASVGRAEQHYRRWER